MTMATTKDKPRRQPKKNTRTRAVQAFACGQCLNVHKTTESASACCRCKKCETKCVELKTWQQLCGHCYYRRDLNERRKALDTAKARLASAQHRLDWLLKEGRPAKGSAWK